MSYTQLERLEDLGVEVMNSWGELHNHAKALRLAIRELLAQAGALETAVDDEMGRLNTQVVDLAVQLEAQMAKHVTEGNRA